MTPLWTLRRRGCWLRPTGNTERIGEALSLYFPRIARQRVVRAIGFGLGQRCPARTPQIVVERDRVPLPKGGANATEAGAQGVHPDRASGALAISVLIRQPQRIEEAVEAGARAFAQRVQHRHDSAQAGIGLEWGRAGAIDRFVQRNQPYENQPASRDLHRVNIEGTSVPPPAM